MTSSMHPPPPPHATISSIERQPPSFHADWLMCDAFRPIVAKREARTTTTTTTTTTEEEEVVVVVVVCGWTFSG